MEGKEAWQIDVWMEGKNRKSKGRSPFFDTWVLLNRQGCPDGTIQNHGSLSETHTHTHTQHGRRSCKLHAIFTDFYFEPLQNEKNRLKDVRVREINAIALFVVAWQIIRDLTFEKHSQLGCFRL